MQWGICEKFVYDICRKPNPTARFKRIVDQDPWCLKYVPDEYKSWEMCRNAVKKDPYFTKYVSDHLRTKRKQIIKK